MFKGNVLFAFVIRGRGLVHSHFKIIIFLQMPLGHELQKVNEWKKGPDRHLRPDSECATLCCYIITSSVHSSG